jgi:hypothetical protein
MRKDILLLVGMFFVVFSMGIVNAAENPNSLVGGLDATVCCEKTNTGLFCQDVPSSECGAGARQVPTSCESTSFCKGGYCYDSTEGTCADNTPQLVCNGNGGTWSEGEPAQCKLGCCTLGDQAAFVTLVRCKRLSAFLGLKTSYDNSVTDEVQCVLSVQNQEKGACVYDFEFERTCKFTTREECGQGLGGDEVEGPSGEFFSGKLCSDEELGTNCGPTTETRCLDGKDEVYFVDSCGNPGNIYDASRVNDDNYWSEVLGKSESCSPGSENANSAACGNCNYLLGSFCREGSATYGDFVCADLNCEDTSNGESYRHGESWCVNNDEGSIGEGKNSVGSRFYKHICINGEEVVETCAEFRQEECIEDTIVTGEGEFTQAACRVNRWQDCTAQEDKIDCENTDRRDCIWKAGKFDVAFLNKSGKGVCLPKNTPGLNFWRDEETKNICDQANAACIVTFEKKLLGGEECVENCHCLEDKWERQHAELCSAIGDCGPNVNWIGEAGAREGYKVEVSSYKDDKDE